MAKRKSTPEKPEPRLLRRVTLRRRKYFCNWEYSYRKTVNRSGTKKRETCTMTMCPEGLERYMRVPKAARVLEVELYDSPPKGSQSCVLRLGSDLNYMARIEGRQIPSDLLLDENIRYLVGTVSYQLRSGTTQSNVWAKFIWS